MKMLAKVFAIIGVVTMLLCLAGCELVFGTCTLTFYNDTNFDFKTMAVGIEDPTIYDFSLGPGQTNTIELLAYPHNIYFSEDDKDDINIFYCHYEGDVKRDGKYEINIGDCEFGKWYYSSK